MSSESELDALADAVRDFVDQEVPTVTQWNVNPAILEQSLRKVGDFLTLIEAQHATLLAKFNADHDPTTGENPVPDEWVVDAGTPTFLSATQFRLTGNRTADYVAGHRVRCLIGGSPVIVAVQSVAFDSGSNVTNVTVDQAVLTGALTQVSRGLVRTSVPKRLTAESTAQLGALEAGAHNTHTGLTATALERIRTDGGGDVATLWQVPGRDWIAGIDNSDGDRWKLGAAAVVGSSPVIIVDPAQLVAIGGAATTPGVAIRLEKPAAAVTSGDGATGEAVWVRGQPGQATSGAGGQTGGKGGLIWLIALPGGAAPAGSTNGDGGDVILQPGAPGAGAGAAGFGGLIGLRYHTGNSAVIAYPLGIQLRSPDGIVRMTVHDSPPHVTLPAACVLTATLADLNVTTGKLANLAVTTPKLADLNVTTGKLADLAVTEPKLGSLAVTNGKLGNLAVTTGKLAVGATLNGFLSAAVPEDLSIGGSETTVVTFASTAFRGGRLFCVSGWIAGIAPNGVGSLTCRLKRNGVTVASTIWTYNMPAGVIIPAPTVIFFDQPTGTFTYTVTVQRTLGDSFFSTGGSPTGFVYLGELG